MKLGVNKEESYTLMKDAVAAIASCYGDSLTVSMVGFGDINDHFEPLQAMAKAALESGAKGSFERCEKMTLSISSRNLFRNASGITSRFSTISFTVPKRDSFYMLRRYL